MSPTRTKNICNIVGPLSGRLGPCNLYRISPHFINNNHVLQYKCRARKKTEMGKTCSMYGREEVHTGIQWENMREGAHLEDPGADGRIILKWIFERLGRVVGVVTLTHRPSLPPKVFLHCSVLQLILCVYSVYLKKLLEMFSFGWHSDRSLQVEVL